MIVLLYLFWLLLNGQWTGEIALVGAVLCLLLWLFSVAFLGLSPRRELQILRRLPGLLRYAGFLLKQIFVSALATIRLIWSLREEAEPRLLTFHSRLRTRYGRLLFANSITLTPGTITAGLEEDTFTVHCLDVSFSGDLAGGEMERRIMALEGGSSHE